MTSRYEPARTYYIAGPMRGYEDYNFPAFDECAANLREVGIVAINPADHDRECPGAEMSELLLWDLDQIAHVADGIVLLPGWEKSAGVAVELALAKALEKEILTYTSTDTGAVLDWLREDNPAEPTSPCDTSCANFGKCFMDGCAEKGVNHDGVYYERPAGEVRVVDPETGGAKGSKRAQLGALDPTSLLALAEVAGMGAGKYERYNFLRGYAWSLSFDAMMRHALAFWAGEDLDAESGLPHAAHVAWHGLTLVAFLKHGLGTDDRPAVGK